MCKNQGRGVSSIVMGIICPPGSDRVNWSAKNWEEVEKVIDLPPVTTVI